jgi:hypothetical protein
MRTGVLEELSVEVAEPRGWTPAAPRSAIDAAQMLTVWVLCVAPALFATSHQYTWSLLIFIAPLAVTTRELYRRGALAALVRPLGLSLAALVPMGAVLTVGLADDFFVYPNQAAVLGITFPAIDLEGVDHAFQIPIEELLFYVLGFASLLMLYAWGDAVLFPQARALASRPAVSLPEFLVSFGLGVSLAAVGWLVQRVLNPGQAMPGYWTYLMLVPVPVVIAFGPVILSRINWQALALVCLALWGHSILWEVTLAVPQGWWGYQQANMVGLKIAAWHDLPIEAVVVWLLTPIATVISFEALRAHLTPVPRRNP